MSNGVAATRDLERVVHQLTMRVARLEWQIKLRSMRINMMLLVAGLVLVNAAFVALIAANRGG
ncbi:MAG: hypothetical protein ACK4V6_05630 [Microthrixaceae bacterium]